MTSWYVIGHHVQLGSGIIRGPIDQFTAYRLKRDLLIKYPTAHLLVIDCLNKQDAIIRAEEYIRGLGIIEQPILGSIAAEFMNSEFASVDTIEFNTRELNSLHLLTAMPGDKGYNNYIKMLDHLIRDDWYIIEEIVEAVWADNQPMIIENSENLLGDLYFRKNFLDYCNRNS